MLSPKVVLVGQPRSYTSLGMRMLMMGGVDIEYDFRDDEGAQKMRENYRNPYGFFEKNHPTGEHCFKVLNAERLRLVDKTTKVIYLVRDFDKMTASWSDVNKRPVVEERRKIMAMQRDKIEAELIGRPVLRIKSEDLVSNPTVELNRIKEFLTPDYDFNVDEAVKAIDPSLIKQR